MSRVVHYTPHMCGPQECDCVPVCHVDGEIQQTSDEKAVTCKNCLRITAARRKPKPHPWEALEAWADECAT